MFWQWVFNKETEAKQQTVLDWSGTQVWLMKTHGQLLRCTHQNHVWASVDVQSIMVINVQSIMIINVQWIMIASVQRITLIVGYCISCMCYQKFIVLPNHIVGRKEEPWLAAVCFCMREMGKGGGRESMFVHRWSLLGWLKYVHTSKVNGCCLVDYYVCTCAQSMCMFIICICCLFC